MCVWGGGELLRGVEVGAGVGEEVTVTCEGSLAAALAALVCVIVFSVVVLDSGCSVVVYSGRA